MRRGVASIRRALAGATAPEALKCFMFPGKAPAGPKCPRSKLAQANQPHGAQPTAVLFPCRPDPRADLCPPGKASAPAAAPRATTGSARPPTRAAFGRWAIKRAPADNWESLPGQTSAGAGIPLGTVLGGARYRGCCFVRHRLRRAGNRHQAHRRLSGVVRGVSGAASIAVCAVCLGGDHVATLLAIPAAVQRRAPSLRPGPRCRRRQTIKTDINYIKPLRSKLGKVRSR